ncbi:hypothetical protein KY499_09635 [Arthrobacter sp. PAMC25284]|nr:hypothetical protein KY499_09635 [Arthrobacter sp. PAMC25284]
MTRSTAKPRPESDPTETLSEAPRHRTDQATPASARSRLAAGLGTAGRRAAVAAAACAVLVGVGAAGQATGTGGMPTVSDTSLQASALSANPLPKLDFETVQDTEPVDAGPEEIPATDTPGGADASPAATEESETPPTEADEVAAAPAPAPAPASAPAPAPAPAPMAVAVDDPAGAQAYAAANLGGYGWDAGQMPCLQKLWTKESDWRTTAKNPSSGAYGIVQSLPAEKMASAGTDYLTNYRTQINWGLNYIKQRYGSPCGALNFHYANNWY